MTGKFLIEKHSHPADIFLSDGRVIEARLFLAEYAQTHDGSQTVRDLIDEPGEVLPAVDTDDEFLLLNKRAVSAVSVAPTELDLEGYWHETPVTLRLIGGHRVEGALLFEDGSGQRLSDAINNAGEWIRVRRSDQLVWVRMSALVSARSSEA
ncbi:MAG: hypothetical protein OEX97_08940 [Acidimicrobiia bacterium]|nr:hypothetical protein [Acidimicrobiia bacterium]